MRNLPEEDEKLVIIWLILFNRKSADYKLLVFSRKQTGKQDHVKIVVLLVFGYSLNVFRNASAI